MTPRQELERAVAKRHLDNVTEALMQEAARPFDDSTDYVEQIDRLDKLIADVNEAQQAYLFLLSPLERLWCETVLFTSMLVGWIWGTLGGWTATQWLVRVTSRHFFRR